MDKAISGDSVIPNCSHLKDALDAMAKLHGSTRAQCYANVLNVGLEIKAAECPCDSGFTKTDGNCTMPQCSDQSVCIQLEDDYTLGRIVCCVKDSVTPKQDACFSGQTAEIFTTTDKLTNCKAYCYGNCTRRTENELYTCCKERKNLQSPGNTAEEGEKLTGGIVAILVVFIIMLFIAGGFGLLYVCRKMKNEKKQAKSIKSSGDGIRLTCLSDIIGDGGMEMVNLAFDNSANYEATLPLSNSRESLSQRPDWPAGESADYDDVIDTTRNSRSNSEGSKSSKKKRRYKPSRTQVEVSIEQSRSSHVENNNDSYDVIGQSQMEGYVAISRSENQNQYDELQFSGVEGRKETQEDRYSVDVNKHRRQSLGSRKSLDDVESNEFRRQSVGSRKSLDDVDSNECRRQSVGSRKSLDADYNSTLPGEIY
ncbi:uncharacterized protein LOC127838750 [Dreissena polymorpha]|nr:uncharacterized protein LOC127838750 [Dreissena polymorpha]